MACLWRYRDLGHTEFPDLVDQQLKSAVERGNDVQAHIHPHWLETEIAYSPNGSSSYEFDLSKFLIGNWFPGDGRALRQFCSGLLGRAKSYLETLLRPVDRGYRCIAYRAGGYGIQPNTPAVLQALIDNGYLIDSSIVPGMVLSSNVNRIDFAQVPRQANYFVSPEFGLGQVSDKGIFEIPVMTLRDARDRWVIARNFPLRVITYLRNSSRSKDLGYGIQSTEKDSGVRLVLREIDRVFHPFWPCELRADATVQMMLDAARRYVDNYYHRGSDIYFAVSLHSKHMNEGILKHLRGFHRRLSEFYGDELEAITYREATRLVNPRGASK